MIFACGLRRLSLGFLTFSSMTPPRSGEQMTDGFFAVALCGRPQDSLDRLLGCLSSEEGLWQHTVTRRTSQIVFDGKTKTGSSNIQIVGFGIGCMAAVHDHGTHYEIQSECSFAER